MRLALIIFWLVWLALAPSKGDFMISRSYAWIDETIEHSDSDCARASALAKKWSELMTKEENASFQRQFDEHDCYDPFEYCECEYCLKNNHKCNHELKNGECSYCAVETELTECEARADWNRQEAEKMAEHDLEVELIEDKLSRLGARMMRPYEHWNEDEAYMQYMENRD